MFPVCPEVPCAAGCTSVSECVDFAFMGCAAVYGIMSNVNKRTTLAKDAQKVAAAPAFHLRVDDGPNRQSSSMSEASACTGLDLEVCKMR